MAGVAVFVNGRRLCVADGGAGGGVTVAINAHDFARPADAPADLPDRPGMLGLSVFGSLPRPGKDSEYVQWANEGLQPGDEVVVRITAAVPSDEPASREAIEKETAVGEYRQHLAECATWLTADERRELLRELIAELQGGELP